MRCRRTIGLRSLVLFLFLFVLGLPFTACRRKTPGTPVIALLPFDNLTPSRGYDWLSAAGPVLLDWQLFGQKTVSVFTAANVNDAEAGHATSFLHTRFEVEGGMLVLEAAVEDAAKSKITAHYSFRVQDSAGGALSALGRLARSLAPSARRIGDDAARALIPFGESLNSNDAKIRADALRAALDAKPDFIPAWLARIEMDMRTRPAAVSDDIAAALPYADALDRSRMRYLSARLSGDSAAQIKALVDLTRRAPAWANGWRNLAEIETTARDFQAAAAAWDAVTRLQPWDGSALNQLGYSRAWAHDADGALRALAEYGRLDPGGANPLDSMGEVQFFFGRYADAEKSFLRAAEKDPAFLDGMEFLKAAEARLMTGDRNAADRLFQQFADWRRGAMRDPQAPLWQARWNFLCGRRRQAMSELAGALPRLSADARSRAESQYAFWLFATGDLAGARAHAEQAAQVARTPVSRGLAILCRFLAMPSASPEVWMQRASAELGGFSPRFRESALAYSLSLDRHAADAILVLERVYATSAPGEDGEQRAMLTSVLLALGRRDQARKLLWPMPIPITSDDAELFALVFPRWLAWAGQETKFRQHAGDLRLVFE